MERLRQRSDRLADVVQLRFFAGLEFAQIAELLGVSLSSVTRDWRSAKALLYVDMREAVSDVQPE
jgi:DNA-directed RNA polymerase specialized sigma24 family protein